MKESLQQVLSLKLKNKYILKGNNKMNEIIIQRIKDSISLKMKLLDNEELLSEISRLSYEITNSIRNGGKIVLCGNGGSASDALHFAGEIVGRFQKERKAWPAIVLNADVATMTAIANDYGYDDVFARQVDGYITSKDIFIGISTSGNSENVLRAVDVAYKKGAKTAALLGKDGGLIGKKVEHSIIIPCNITARIQECHIMIIHIICEIVENSLS